MTHRRSRPSESRGRKVSWSLGLLSACLAAAVLPGCTEEEKALTGQPSTVLVERVIDGDTVVLTRLGTTRLIGVNTPEEGRCGDNAATRFTRRRLEDKRVKVEFGEDRKDLFDRRLAYLTRGDTMHNLALVEEGYAKVRTIPPNDKYADRFEVAEEEAKQQHEGPQADCAAKRRPAIALRRARARARAARAERAESAARRLRAAERRVAKRQQRRDRGAGDSAGGSGSDDGGSDGGGSDGDIPKNCSGVNGPIPTPTGDPTNLDGNNDGQACE